MKKIGLMCDMDDVVLMEISLLQLNCERSENFRDEYVMVYEGEYVLDIRSLWDLDGLEGLYLQGSRMRE